MKRFTFIFTALLLTSLNLQAGGGWGAILTGSPPSAAVTEYFGNLTTGTASSFDTWGGYTLRNNDGAVPYTCPGSGTRRVVSIEVWIKSNGGTPGVIRLAVYDTSLNLVGQGTAGVAVTSTTVGWVGHVGTLLLQPVSGVPGAAVNVTGGTNYIGVFSVASNDSLVAYSLDPGTMYYQNVNNTGGFSNPLGGSDTLFQENFRFRIGVQ